ncbi:MAG TPA: sigma-70 family RNA polymerase sigma factor [Cytophaga sp.]|nr:sigma-70 family RNA polymerase sigma factor [Cytophaga sp.]
MDSISKEKLADLLDGCIKKDRNSQRLLYTQFFSLGMSIALRYSNSKEEAGEILNDAFLKIFNKLSTYTIENSFNGWLRRIVINTAVDYYRKNKKHNNHLPLEDAAVSYNNVLDEMQYEDLAKLVQALSPAYRTIFNLYVVDGYSHKEIAEIMNITTGASKSGLSRARLNLQHMLKKNYNIDYERNAG